MFKQHLNATIFTWSCNLITTLLLLNKAYNNNTDTHWHARTYVHRKTVQETIYSIITHRYCWWWCRTIRQTCLPCLPASHSYNTYIHTYVCMYLRCLILYWLRVYSTSIYSPTCVDVVPAVRPLWSNIFCLINSINIFFSQPASQPACQPASRRPKTIAVNLFQPFLFIF